jgi:hypothetical protein
MTAAQLWKDWFKRKRVLPLLTISMALLANGFSLIGVIELTIAEQIIIAILALIAIDALIERLDILERLEEKLSTSNTTFALRSRNDLIAADKQAAHAVEICILAVSAISLSVRHLSFFEQKIRAGCRLRVILLDPTCDALNTWNLVEKWMNTANDIQASLMAFTELMEVKDANVEIRLTKVFLPYSLFISDLTRPSASMVVEYHTYKTALDDRPHIFLTPESSNHWFTFYRNQFELTWAEAKSWQPDKSGA